MESIAAVIVTYHPKIELEDSINAISCCVQSIYVVDNGSTTGLEILARLEKREKVKVARLGYNLGIATALNHGVKVALESGANWILTLDQDTFLPSSSVQKMLDAYAVHPRKDKIGIIAPTHFDKESGYQNRYLRGLKGPHTTRQIVMSSGNLIKRSTFEKVPYYDDDLFIDYVDHDFCLKVKRVGLETIIAKEAQMAHSEGNIKRHIYGPISFFSHNYNPERQYYRARNRIILYRRHFGSWIWQDQEFAIKNLLKVLLVEQDAWKKVKAIWQGTIDGFLGRMGSFHGATYLTPKAQKYFVEFREEVIPLLPNGTAGRVLDLGCGSGETSGFFKNMGRFQWVCGVEGSPDAANIARNRLDQVLVDDIEQVRYPFAEGSFDLIMALDILEHLVDPWTAVKKLRLLLKPGGSLIVSLPNVRHFSVIFPLIFFGDWRYSQEGLLDSTHIRFFTRRTAITMFEAEGFVLDKADHTGGKRRLSGVMNKLTLGIFREFFIFQNLFSFSLKVSSAPANSLPQFEAPECE